MSQRKIANTVIAINLILFAYAFATEESHFPFHSYDVYSMPMAKAGFVGLKSPLQASFYALDENNEYYELGLTAPFFFPFDRFLFSEVLFFNTVRVKNLSPLAEKASLEERLKSHLRSYNRKHAWQRPRFFKRVDVYWSDIEIDKFSNNLSDHKELLFSVPHD